MTAYDTIDVPDNEMKYDDEQEEENNKPGIFYRFFNCFCNPPPMNAPTSVRYSIYCLLVLVVVSILDQADAWSLPTLQAAGLQCSSCGQDSFQEKCLSECLNLDDVLMGLLTGPAVRLGSVVIAIPLGWYSDRYSRVRLLTYGLITWSSAMIASYFCTNFWELAACRIVLGVGAATVNPTAFSLLADYFPKENHSFVFAVFFSMVYVGIDLGLLMTFVSVQINWRVCFLILGSPGIAVAILMFCTVKDPQRQETTQTQNSPISDGIAKNRSFRKSKKISNGQEVTIADENDIASSDDNPSIFDARTILSEGTEVSPKSQITDKEKEKAVHSEGSHEWLKNSHYNMRNQPNDSSTEFSQTNKPSNYCHRFKVIFKSGVYLCLWLSSLFRYFAGYALGNWMSVFYRRKFSELSPEQISLILAIIIPSAGLTGSFLGGYLADKWARYWHPGTRGIILSLSSLLGLGFIIPMLLVDVYWLSFLFLLLSLFFAEMWPGPAVTIAQESSPPNMKSLATTIFYTTSGLGSLSTLVVGFLNKQFAMLPEESISPEPTPSPSTLLSSQFLIPPSVPIPLATISPSFFSANELATNSTIEPPYLPTYSLLIVTGGGYLISFIGFTITAILMFLKQVETPESKIPLINRKTSENGRSPHHKNN